MKKESILIMIPQTSKYPIMKRAYQGTGLSKSIVTQIKKCIMHIGGSVSEKHVGHRDLCEDPVASVEEEGDNPHTEEIM